MPAITCYIQNMNINIKYFDYIWTNLQKQLPTWQETFPKPIHVWTDQLISDASRALRWREVRGVLDADDSIDEDIRCIGLPLTVHGNERIDYSSKMILLSFCCVLLLQLVAMGVEMQSNMNLYEQIFMDLHDIMQAGEVLPNSSSNTNRVE